MANEEFFGADVAKSHAKRKLVRRVAASVFPRHLNNASKFREDRFAMTFLNECVKLM